MYHLLRADEFGAAEAYRIGLVQEVVEPGEQVERAIALAREMLQCSPSALDATPSPTPVSRSTRTSLRRSRRSRRWRRAVQATEDFQEGIASFIERRPAQFTGR